ILVLSDLVGQQLSQAMQSFIGQNEDLAKNVIRCDDEIDNRDARLELDALELITIQQPVVQDLRFLSAAIRVSHELERISDYACDIAEITLRLQTKGEWFKPLIDLPRMVEVVQGMLHKSILAYQEQNLTLAGELDDDDTVVDGFYIKLYEELTLYIKNNPDSVEQAFSILLVVRYLERIADHAVNVGEMVIFAATGERHPFKGKVDSAG
ncbi:MAG TPA: phosphate signaling complex protein PhoU, partial [Bacillota bacterium]|nr:phosphate signaling complex protein PhoU [Bacillota bacterium]